MAVETGERLRSFDLLASVNMMRYDLEHFNEVLPETRQQVCDEQLSHLAEGIDRAARTTFIFKRQGQDFVYFRDGEWHPYNSMLKTGLEVAELEAKIDPRRQFLVSWAQNDLFHSRQMHQLQPGEQRFWFNPYPYDEEQSSGAEFLKSCGLQPDRQMGFLYRASCLEDGSIMLETQTVDRSDDEAFAAATLAIKNNSAVNLDDATQAYDDKLKQKQGGFFYAGRRNSEIYENAWEQIRTSSDLVEYLLDKLETIARQPATPDQLETMAKKHIYGVWALFKKRLDGSAAPNNFSTATNPISQKVLLANQVSRAYQEFVAEGRALIGCGGAITIHEDENDILSASVEDVFKSIFGVNRSETCKYISEQCPECGEKKVVTTEIKKSGREKIIMGSCGCSKTIKLKRAVQFQ